MEIYGPLSLKNNQLQQFVIEHAVGTFPTGKIGRVVYRTDENMIFLCVQEVPTPLWLPLVSPAAFFPYVQSTADTLWIINHGLDSDDVFVQVYDSTGLQIIPEEIQIYSSNEVRIHFSTAYTGKAIIAVMNEMQIIASQLSGASAYFSDSGSVPAQNPAPGTGEGSIAMGEGAIISDVDYAIVGGGYFNTVNANWGSIGGGRNNIASGPSSTVAGGNGNSVEAQYGAIPGGSLNQISSDAIGGYASGIKAYSSNYGQRAFASGSFSGGERAQISDVIFRNTTSSNTPGYVYLDGASETFVGAINQIYVYDGLAIANNITSGLKKCWKISGAFITDGLGVAILAGSPAFEILDEDAGMETVDIQPVVLNDNFTFTITGLNGATIRWAASIRILEIG